MAKIKISSAKAKGREFQKLIARGLAQVLGLVYGTDQDVGSRGMGQQGTDIVMSAEARRRFPYAVECKNQETVNLWGAVRQARANCPEGMSWLVAIKKNRERPIIVMDWVAFLELVRDANVFRNSEGYCRDLSGINYDVEKDEARPS